ncbi:response regulator [Sagittula stellata]|uniref:response regulator n=1 Tax=Sagittula stellata TaxID=52603 RepID=UPI00030239DC|nr:response regulator [Sagittula stellata]
MPNSFASVRLLVVDDFPEDREQIADLAQSIGIETVLEAERSESALEEIRKGTVDCVMVDHRLDGEDGLDLVDEIHKHWPRLPIIVLSGQGNEKVAAAALRGGALRYMPKRGMDAGALRSAIDNAMRWARHFAARPSP